MRAAVCRKQEVTQIYCGEKKKKKNTRSQCRANLHPTQSRLMKISACEDASTVNALIPVFRRSAVNSRFATEAVEQTFRGNPRSVPSRSSSALGFARRERPVSRYIRAFSATSRPRNWTTLIEPLAAGYLFSADGVFMPRERIARAGPRGGNVRRKS